MNKVLLTCAFLASLSGGSFAQTAPDFTATDCRENVHNLYSELAQGKVIVIEWVMPCASCIGPAMTAYNVCESFNNPNVLYYLMDDVANTACLSLSTWASNIGIGPNRIIFSTSTIDQLNYGGFGMPHVIVIGANGTIYFNGFNLAAGNYTAIQDGISAALLSTGMSSNDLNTSSISISPNPAEKSVMLNYVLVEPASVSLEVVNETAQQMASYSIGAQDAGQHTYSFDVNGFATGNYFVRFKSGQHMQVLKLAVTH